MSLETRLQALTTEYQKLEEDLAAAVEARQKLDAQLTENEQIKKEFEQLKPSNTVYKLIGSVLVKQEHAEAKANVETRLEYIRGEIKRVEVQLKELGVKSEKKKADIVTIQTAYQQQQKQKQEGTTLSATASA